MLLTTADDDGYLFRSITSDAAQGPALASLAQEEGYTNVGVIFFDDAYGRGLAESFAAAWRQQGQELTMAAIQGDAESYLAELRMLAEQGAEVLVVITFVSQAEVFLREAIAHQLFDRFLFVDATKRQYLIDVIGAEHLNGMKGTSHAPAPESEGLQLYLEAYRAMFGEPSGSDFVPTTYDAVIAIGLAAALADSTDGAAIRDALPRVAGPDGHKVLPGAAGIAGPWRSLLPAARWTTRASQPSWTGTRRETYRPARSGSGSSPMGGSRSCGWCRLICGSNNGGGKRAGSQRLNCGP